MEQGIEIRIVWGDADALEACVEVRSSYFAGIINVYTSTTQIQEIASALEQFPTTTSDGREVVLGAFGPGWAGGGISLRFFCADRSGHVLVEVNAESGDEIAGLVESCRFVVATEASAIDQFVNQLKQMSELRDTARLSSPNTTSLWRKRYPSAEEMLREDRNR
jgi:hypothetical protein